MFMQNVAMHAVASAVPWKNVVPDSSAIVEYLHNTYPSKMSALIPADPVRYVHIACFFHPGQTLIHFV